MRVASQISRAAAALTCHHNQVFPSNFKPLMPQRMTAQFCHPRARPKRKRAASQRRESARRRRHKTSWLIFTTPRKRRKAAGRLKRPRVALVINSLAWMTSNWPPISGTLFSRLSRINCDKNSKLYPPKSRAFLIST